MTDNQDNKFVYYTKIAWVIYTLIIISLMAVLVFFVAEDNEEMFFFGLITPAAAYVFRPTSRYIGRLVFKYTGVSETKEQE